MTKLDPSRRDFCVAAGAGVVALGLVACDPGDPRLGNGEINQPGGTGTNGNQNPPAGDDMSGPDTGPGPDMSQAQDMGRGRDMSPDASEPPAGDMAPGGGCESGMTNAGAKSAYSVGGTPKFFKDIDAFVLRDQGGLFAVSAVCTHQGCDCQYQNGKFYCACHGATFALDGSKPTSPASRPLPHHALCIDSAGTVWINPKAGSVDAATRY